MSTRRSARLALAGALLVAASAAAQSGGRYDLRWGTVGAGGRSAGGRYALDGSAGQAVTASSGAGRTVPLQLRSGFWPGVATGSGPGDAVFRDGFE